MEVSAMRSASGPIGALLVIAPLVAIPVVAIVGIPQFAPVVASSSLDDDFGEEPLRNDFATTAPLNSPRGTPPVRYKADDLFAPVEAPRRGDPAPAWRGDESSATVTPT